MELFADPITINCRKVLAGLNLMNIEYSLKKIDFFEGEQKSDSYLAINPNAKLPAMRDEGLVIWESNSILQYAADKHGKNGAYPTDLKARADVNRWLFWECGSWFPSCYIFMVENCVKPLLGGAPDIEILAGEDENFHMLAGVLNARLRDSPYICGDAPTLADVAVAAPMHLYGWQKLPLGRYANIERWMTERIEPSTWWKQTHVGEGFSLVAAE
ncbi:glutathione S-transferase family protein [Ruegeria hyattellae]|uniref:glutathione S-transferase family protein n=1 Tax=Ruegeria hyattellae TaxID=3233337 RepID=UPI00355B8CAE